MLSQFFIERPIFANVMAIAIILFGAVALRGLPVELYPQVTPPTVRVTANYPGASAQIVANTVAAPIEQQVNGVENMIYMSSYSASDGSYTLTATFDVGTNIDMAQVLLQNRVQIALPQLPQEVQRQGIITKKQSTDIIMFVTLTSPSGRFDSLFLSNYALISLRDELLRIPGVGDIVIVGSGNYSMRLWLDADALAARGLTAGDVITALVAQNVQVTAGQIGRPPSTPGQVFQYNVSTQGRLTDPQQFGQIILKSTPGRPPSVVRVRDVARVELGAQVYDQYFQVNGVPAAGMAVFQLPGANALDVANRIRARMEQLKLRFPEGMQYAVPFDTTRFVIASVHEVYMTLLEAGGMVLLVILLFLQSWRAVLVPATAVPVTIVGSFAAMYLLGFTANLLTLFGLVLAIGIVIDDSIVIVENATRHLEVGVTPRESAIKAMAELLSPIIGITLVLTSVFLPASFLGGITGQLYRQFALTIAATAILSAFNAVTFKPAQCALYLRPPVQGRRVFFVFRAFNRLYKWTERGYVAATTWLLGRTRLVMGGYAVLVVVAIWGFAALPKGFLPLEDQGYFIVSTQLPDAASQERTGKVVDQLRSILSATPGIQNVNAIIGQNVFDQTLESNAAACYVTLKDWSERTTPEQSLQGLLGGLNRRFHAIPEATIIAFPPPSIRGLGVSGGFQMEVEDRGGVGLDQLAAVTGDLVRQGNARTDLRSLDSTFRAGVPQIYLDIDRTKAEAMNLPIDNVFLALETYLGSSYVNDFNLYGRTYQVRVQAEADDRDAVEKINNLYTRNRTGNPVPLGSVLRVRRTFEPQVVQRYNLYPAAAITGQAAPGVSSGQALETMERLARSRLPRDMSYEWTAMAYQEKLVGNQAIFVLAMAVTLVYLVLAAQYESWITPAAVILVVPLALLGTITAVAIRGLDNNVYTQVGIALIVALASKNAILIVEFARQLRATGKSITESALEAAEKRFRPILMTSMAFIMGVLPLVVAQGAGAASRRALGTAVFGGMIASTLLAVFFVPIFFVLSQHISEWRNRSKKSDPNSKP